MTQKPKIVPAVDDPAKSEETIGKISLDLQSKGTMDTDAIELQREIHKGSNSEKSFDEEVWAAVDRGRKDSNIDGIFYVVVLFKKERALQNIIRQYFFYRQSCPTPEFDQTVYCYRPKTDSIEFLWTIPNNVACNNLPKIRNDLPEEQQTLIHMIDCFLSGELDMYAAKLNKEQMRPPLVS